MIHSSEKKTPLQKQFFKSKTVKSSNSTANSTPTKQAQSTCLTGIQFLRQNSLKVLGSNQKKKIYMFASMNITKSASPTKKSSSKSLFSLRDSFKGSFKVQKVLSEVQKSLAFETKKAFLQEDISVDEVLPAQEQVSQSVQGVKDHERLALSIMAAYKEEGYSHLENIQNRQMIGKCLQRHRVTAQMRTKIVDWIHQTLSIFELGESTFFSTVQLIDRCFAATSNEIQASDLHLLSTTVLFIASKFNEVCHLTMNEVYEKIGHAKFSKEELTQKELEVLQMLGFCTTTATSMDFLQHFNILLFEDNLSLKVVYSLALILLKINLLDYEMCEIDPSLQAASALYLALTLCESSYKCSLVDEHFMKDLSKMCKHEPDEIQAVVEKTHFNAENMRIKFPRMNSIIDSNFDLFSRHFPEVVSCDL